MKCLGQEWLRLPAWWIHDSRDRIAVSPGPFSDWHVLHGEVPVAADIASSDSGSTFEMGAMVDATTGTDTPPGVTKRNWNEVEILDAATSLETMD